MSHGCVMLNLVVLLAASLVPIMAVHSNRLSRSDIDAILKIIQTQQRSESDSDSSYEKLTLRNSQLVDLLHRSLLEENKRNKKDRRESKVYRHESNENDEELNRILDQNKDDDDDDNYLGKKRIRPFHLNHLLSNKKDKEQKNYGKNKLVPNNLLESYQDRNDRSLSDYSKIYIILNPDAVKTSQNKKKLANLISRLLSKSSQNEEDPLLEAYSDRQSNRRDAGEKGYPLRDSMEEPRPKRQRYNNYGGGGGAGGRTAIPYIRNRGDIYVRDRDQ